MSSRKRLRILCRTLIVCLLLSLLGSCAADRLVLGENHEQLKPEGMTRRVVVSEGRSIECWLARSPGALNREPEATVLYFVGKGDRADRWTAAVAGAWGDRPVELWGMNYPGSGGSDGPVRLDLVAPSAVAVYDAALAARPGKPVFIQAGSFGTTAALAVAARRPVAGMVLQNPPPLRQLILGRHGWWNLWILAGPVAARIPDSLDSVANARQATAPAIFLLSGADEVIPPKYHALVTDAYAGPKRIVDMPAAGHNSPLTKEGADGLAAGLTWMWDRALTSSASAPTTRPTGSPTSRP